MPDGTKSDLEGPANVILLLAEDAAADTVRPRLDAAGADPHRIFELQGISHPGKEGIRPITLADVQKLREAIDQHTARLVVVDTFLAFVGGRNSHRDEAMRGILTPLADLAEQTGAAIVLIRHPRKSSGSAITSGAGSLGITGAVRAELLVGKDPQSDDGRILAISKLNIGKPAPSISFTIETKEVKFGTHNGEAPIVKWGESTETTADELVAASREEPQETTQLKAAGEWLLDALADGPLETHSLEKAAHKKFSSTTFGRARTGLRKSKKIWTAKESWALGSWWWGLGPQPPDEWTAEHRSAAGTAKAAE
jgi:hypothetical protein